MIFFWIAFLKYPGKPDVIPLRLVNGDFSDLDYYTNQGYPSWQVESTYFSTEAAAVAYATAAHWVLINTTPFFDAYKHS